MKLSIICLIFLVAGCHKEDPIQPDPPLTSKPIFEKIWSNRIYDAPLENVGSDNAYYYKDLYLLSGDHYSHVDPTLYAFDIKTGLLKWKWQQSGRLQEPAYLISGKDEILIGSNSKGIFAFDIEKQKLLWEDIYNDYNQKGDNRLLIHGDFVYTTTKFGDFYGEAYILRYNIQTGSKELIWTVPLEGIWSPSLSPPSFWVDENGATIMLFINGKSNIDYSPQKSPTDLWAVNLTTRKLLWKINNIMEVPTNLLNPPIVYKDKIIFGGDWSVYSVNIPNGKVNWRTQFPEMGKFGCFNRTGLLLVGDKVFGNPDGFDIFCLNAETGNVIWHEKSFKNGAPTCSPKMLYNDNMLITTSWGKGEIMIYDANTGILIHNEDSPNTYYTDVIYDKTTNMYFVQDFAHAVGFKINKPK